MKDERRDEDLKRNDAKEGKGVNGEKENCIVVKEVEREKKEKLRLKVSLNK